MIKGVYRKPVWWSVLGLVALLFWPQFLRSEQAQPGNIIGFIYDQDGTTPLTGAVLKFKNLTSGAIYDSSRSDANGIFTVRGIESGVYTYGVVTEAGGFNAAGVVGLQVSEKQTAKMSIALKPYGREEAAAVKELNRDRETQGESMVGLIADFDAATQLARVEVVKGILRVNDKIHTQGPATNFYQDVAVLKFQNGAARQLLPGQTGSILLKQSAQTGDRVFVVQDKKVFPFFLAPAGVAAVIAGNMAVTHGVLRITDEGEPVSAYKNR
jgi:hypothetical protein